MSAPILRLSRGQGKMYIGKAKRPSRYTVAPKEYRLIDGIQFDSMADCIRYGQLNVRKVLGEVSDIKYHHVFNCCVNGVFICKYEVDFAYIECGVEKYEEVKSGTSGKERDWKLRRKLAQAIFGITIDVVTI